MRLGGNVLFVMAALLASAGLSRASSEEAAALIELTVSGNKSVLKLAARFTKAGAVKAVRGQLVQYHPTWLCDGTRTDRRRFSATWITIVKLEKIEFDPCTIAQKVEATLQSGTAAVIFDVTEQREVTEQLQLLYHDLPFTQLPPVLVLWGNDAFKLEEFLLRNRLVMAHVAVDPISDDGYEESSLGMYLLIFIVVMMVACVFCAAIVIRVKLQEYSKPVSPTDDISRIVKSLSTRRYRLSFAHASNCASDVISQTSSRKETCAICLEDYSDRQVLRTLPCGHEYHKLCVDPWLIMKQTCPLCVSNIVELLFNEDCHGPVAPSQTPATLPSQWHANTELSQNMSTVQSFNVSFANTSQHERTSRIYPVDVVQNSVRFTSSRRSHHVPVDQQSERRYSSRYTAAGISQPHKSVYRTTQYHKRNSLCSPSPVRTRYSYKSQAIKSHCDTNRYDLKPILRVHTSANSQHLKMQYPNRVRLSTAKPKLLCDYNKPYHKRPLSCHTRLLGNHSLFAQSAAKRHSYPCSMVSNQWDADISSLSSASASLDGSSSTDSSNNLTAAAAGDSIASIFGSSGVASVTSSLPKASNLSDTWSVCSQSAEDFYVDLMQKVKPCKSSLSGCAPSTCRAKPCNCLNSILNSEQFEFAEYSPLMVSEENHVSSVGMQVQSSSRHGEKSLENPCSTDCYFCKTLCVRPIQSSSYYSDTNASRKIRRNSGYSCNYLESCQSQVLWQHVDQNENIKEELHNTTERDLQRKNDICRFYEYNERK